MPFPVSDDPSVLRDRPLISWQGAVFRSHHRRYAADDPGGSLRVSGRFHRGQDFFPPDQAWAALYLSLGRDVALGELVRHTAPNGLALLNDWRITELFIATHRLMDWQDPTYLGLTVEELMIDGNDSAPTQHLAAAAIAAGAEGILVPSATRLGANLVLFVSHLDSRTEIRVGNSVEPRLFRGS